MSSLARLVLKIKMDCKSNVILRVVVLIVVLPAVLWGYSKTVLGFVQTSNDTSVDGAIPAGSQPEKNGGEATGSDNLKSLPPANGRDAELQVSSPLQTGFSTNSELVDVGAAGVDEGTAADRSEAGQPGAADIAGAAPIPGHIETGSIAPERHNPSSAIEPLQAEETYNQVRVKRPSIPSRFDVPGNLKRSGEESKTGSPVGFVGLLGVPTLVFSLLFFVMWGIISGRIQRIMF